jgi:ribosomal protein S18 acetylase RimI-like enzyme
MITITDIIISELNAKEIVEVSSLLANSMSTNPNHLAIFKSSKPTVIEKQRKMFEMVLKNPNNKSFTAKFNDQIVGTMTYTTSDYCQLRPLDLLKSMPRFITIFGIHLLPVLRWRMNWGKHDYKHKHNHFGPLAVDPNYQGNGVGKSLLKHYCDYLDITNQIGYLETDKEVNIGLYEKFGFQIIETDKILGVKNWFMVRKPTNL